MTTAGEQIRIADAAICYNIGALADQRDLLAQNILSQLRNLIEGVAVRLESGSFDTDYDYDAIKRGETFIKANGTGPPQSRTPVRQHNRSWLPSALPGT